MTTRAAPLRLGLALVVFTVLTLLLFRPTPSELTSTLPAAGGSSADALLLAWATSHVSQTLFTRPTALFDAGIFHPLRNALALGDHMIGEALLGLPIWLATRNPLLEYNLLSLASYVAGATAMFAYARIVVGGGLVPALVAGLVFAFTPPRFAAPLWLQLLWTAFIPLSLAAWLQFVATRGSTPWILWVACMIAQSLMGQYVALYFGIVMGVVVAFSFVAAPARRDPRLWIGTLLAPLLVTLVLWPTIAPYLALREAQHTIRSEGLGTPLAFLWPGPGSLLARAVPLDTTIALGPGIVAWGLALCGLLLGRRGPAPRVALPPAFVWSVHALGLATSLALILTPIRWQHLLPGLDMTRNTNRALFVGLFFLAALAASAVRWIAARGPRARRAAVVVLALAVADVGRPPLDRQPIPTADTLPPGVQYLRTLPTEAIVYEMADVPETVARSMYHAIFHGHRMPVGYSGFSTPGGQYANQRLVTFPAAGAARLLRDLDVGWVLMRVAPGPAADDVIARATAHGAALVFQQGPELVFDVRGLTPPESPAPTSAQAPPATQLTASSGSEQLAQLVDGNPATAWAGAPVPDVPPALTVDLGAIQPVAGVELLVPRDRATAAFRSEIAVSEDGERWQSIDTVFEPVDLDAFLTQPAAHLSFTARWPAAPARFIRLTNPFLVFWQKQLQLLTVAAERLGLPLELGWQGEWVLDELRVLTPATDDGRSAAPS